MVQSEGRGPTQDANRGGHEEGSLVVTFRDLAGEDTASSSRPGSMTGLVQSFSSLLSDVEAYALAIWEHEKFGRGVD